MSIGADSTIAPIFASGVAVLAAAGTPKYTQLVTVLALMVGAIVAAVGGCDWGGSPTSSHCRSSPGSDISIAANTPNKAAALDWVKLMTNAENQTAMVRNDGLIPNSSSLLSTEASDPIRGVFYNAASNSQGTPASPGWATIENDNTMETLYAAVASGTKSIRAAAAAADSHFDQVLNQAP